MGVRVKISGLCRLLKFNIVMFLSNHECPEETNAVIGSANYSDMRETYYRLHNSPSPVKITLTA
ncbi:hypothetical protein T12_6140 [Trichinella patagoniensis]|uniref:Uncharacterized protein n=1 Tax=Trichinella patagoniensis TaxID=990121 RepID=A0A0V0ZPE2_9BILA|nr:hypothetical protein T12_6140 [Trichinella patagoniensis]